VEARVGYRARRLLVMAGMALVAGSPHTAPASPVQGQTPLLVEAEAGDLPIILTAPHGGSEEIPDVAPRATGTTSQDARTLEITRALKARLGAQYCQQPYAVMARFHRRYLDANRPEPDAYEQPAARPHYVAYHETIRAYVDEVRRRFPDGAILVDIHGQSEDPGTIHRGTQNGRTVARLLERQGDGALVGEHSIFGRLQGLGYQVFPPVPPPGNQREHPAYNGGYTVQTYGSHHAEGIDAIQIELGMDLRRPATMAQLVDDLAESIESHYRAVIGGVSRSVSADVDRGALVTDVAAANSAVLVR
jgi:N-formylglutamate amidohydrolase